MIRFRAFRNGDPPFLAGLWNRGLPAGGVVRPLTAHEFNELILGRLFFDAEALIVAELGDQPVGFAHAAFGPLATTGRLHRLDRAMGTVAMLVVDPSIPEPGLADGLFTRAVSYLSRSGAKVIYAGGQRELSSYYWGVYGGSECSGILGTHQAFRLASEAAGFEPVATTSLLEVDLAAPEVRDPKSLLVRRQTRLEVLDDARPADWWEASALGSTTISRFRLLAKSDGRELARASTWDMAAFGRLDGRSRTGIYDVEVAVLERRKGFGRFLISEILRHCRAQWGQVVSIQARSTNRAALALYESVGFQESETSTLYRRPGPRTG